MLKILGDLSGKPLPQAALLESERSLNSPVSHVSAASSRHSRGHRHNQQRQSPAARGLTSENVARFNQRTQQQQACRIWFNAVFEEMVKNRLRELATVASDQGQAT